MCKATNNHCINCSNAYWDVRCDYNDLNVCPDPLKDLSMVVSERCASESCKDGNKSLGTTAAGEAGDSGKDGAGVERAD